MKAFTIVLILLIPCVVSAEPTVETSFTFYNIYPMSKGELGKEMHKRSTIKRNGKTFKGHTHWSIKWKFKWKRRNGICNITKVTTHLSVIYTMPKIPTTHKVNESVRHSFKNYYGSLLNHEKGHMRSGLYAARDIEKALLNLGPFNSCDNLDKKANETGRMIIKNYNKWDKEYDKKTNNGKTEGVDVNNFI